MNANKTASARKLGSDLKRVNAHVIAPHEYEELPEITDEMLAKGNRQQRAETQAGRNEKTDFVAPARRRHPAVAGHGAWLADTYGGSPQATAKVNPDPNLRRSLHPDYFRHPKALPSHRYELAHACTKRYHLNL